jgi:hypothetical protein
MSAIGDSSRWQDQIVTAYDVVHNAVMDVWPACRHRIDSVAAVAKIPSARQRKKAARRRLEDPITRDLIRHLRTDPRLRVQFHIISQYELIDTDYAHDADPLGYVDVAILFSIDAYEVCLVIECKRLNVNGASLAAQYVSEGMLRFVKGQYAPDLPIGGMIGYVMDGRVPIASRAVVDQIVERAKVLLIDSGINFISAPDHFSTKHLRRPVGIELRHQLLSAVRE